MTLPDALRQLQGQLITIRTAKGSQEIYVGPADAVDYDKVNDYCLHKLESPITSAEFALDRLHGKAKQVKAKYLENALQRRMEFVPVQLREVVSLDKSLTDPRYTFITITGTESGVMFNPDMGPLEMNTTGALNLLAGIYRTAKFDMLNYWRNPPPPWEESKVEDLEKFILSDAYGMNIDGTYFLNETRKIYEQEQLDKYRVIGLKVPRKWRDKMNKVILMGRLTADPELKQGQNGNSYMRFSLAVNRRGQDGADFISCAVFGQRAEALAKYGQKGTRLLICGHINIDSYDDNGQRRYNTTVIIDDWEFTESKKTQDSRQQNGSGALAGAGQPGAGQQRQPQKQQRQRPQDDYYYEEPGFY